MYTERSSEDMPQISCPVQQKGHAILTPTLSLRDRTRIVVEKSISHWLALLLILCANIFPPRQSVSQPTYASFFPCTLLFQMPSLNHFQSRFSIIPCIYNMKGLNSFPSNLNIKFVRYVRNSWLEALSLCIHGTVDHSYNFLCDVHSRSWRAHSMQIYAENNLHSEQRWNMNAKITGTCRHVTNKVVKIQWKVKRDMSAIQKLSFEQPFFWGIVWYPDFSGVIFVSAFMWTVVIFSHKFILIDSHTRIQNYVSKPVRFH
jgi:hypothetical protein